MGEGTLSGRPNAHLLNALRAQGLHIRGEGEEESIPIHYSGGQLNGGKITINGSLSSQFISALLISCPQLKNDSKIFITGEKIVSTDYLVMTEAVLKEAGIKLRKQGQRRYVINGRQKFKGLKNFKVPSDYGLAAFLMAGAALLRSDVTLEGFLDDKFLQADGAIIEFLKKMNVRFKKTKTSINIKGPFTLKGGNFSLKNAPDLVPIMTVLGLFAKAAVRLSDIAHVKAKESDRMHDLKNELLKIGAKIDTTPTAMTIHPHKDYKRDVLLDPHNDHRLAMAFSVLGLRLGCKIKNIECVSKSYPDFLRDLKFLGARVKKC
ncbi:MAG: hypothetical protein A2Z88_06565 [Omnitrophica WOR_2 bacterium GWA2_47_8]|nr:MAG: hypothetical protein A2Z88_06565 [Omnitrophica WOR_2 bacterium GWA2_47_8]